MIRLTDALCTAHRFAYTKANLVHRDISDGNIMIYEDPEKPGNPQSLLLDWELAKTKEELEAGPVQPSRSVRLRLVHS